MDTLIPGKMPSFLKSSVSQVAMVVEDLDRTIEHYWKELGVGPWSIYTYAKPLVKQMSYYGEPANYKMRIALANLGHVQFELIEAMDGNSIYADFVKEHGYGIHHIQFLIEDVKSALAEAKAAGIDVIQDGSGYGLDGDGYFGYLNTEEKFGITIELVSPPKRRIVPERIYPPQ
jgi:methylmalonyl-CoA/ethylmalonyl-CoA epimerase